MTLEVHYSARPRAGMAFGPDPRQPDKQFVTTYGEGGIHANWLPIYNDVNDKFTTEMRITVPQPYTVVSRATPIHPTVTELIPTVLQGLKPLQ